VTRAIAVAIVLAAAVGCSKRGGGAPTRETIPSKVFDPGSGVGSGSAADETNYRNGPAGFPIPKDASTVEDTPPDHTFKILRRQPEVVAELKVNLAQMGFKIEDEFVEDTVHTHWYITHGSVVYRVSVAGDSEGHSLIILTID
jgi:hypothetical protein